MTIHSRWCRKSPTVGASNNSSTLALRTILTEVKKTQSSFSWCLKSAYPIKRPSRMTEPKCFSKREAEFRAGKHKKHPRPPKRQLTIAQFLINGKNDIMLRYTRIYKFMFMKTTPEMNAKFRSTNFYQWIFDSPPKNQRKSTQHTLV